MLVKMTNCTVGDIQIKKSNSFIMHYFPDYCLAGCLLVQANEAAETDYMTLALQVCSNPLRFFPLKPNVNKPECV